MKREEQKVYEYLRHNKKFPNMWCPGCGIGIVLGSLIRAIDEVGLDKDEIALISGIGCTGRMPVYADFNTMHTTHGRALAFASGLKLYRPDMHVIVVMGDGDAVAIGGNHFIHAARRNIDITTIIVNNAIYGMTGGQYSPTTPLGSLATTAPYGNIEQPVPICDLATASGAAFVARTTVYHAHEMDKLIEQGLRKKGFSVIEVMSYCHTTYGRINKKGRAVDMMRVLKEQSIPLSASEKLASEESAGKIVRGVLMNRELPEYTERYEQIIGRAKELAEVPLESETELAAPPITKWAECGSSSRDEEDKRFEIRLAGEGGQGLILAGLILAEAATIYDGKKATQTQSYGPEARGGASKSEVIISNGDIDFPKVILADFLLAMSQEACDKYFREIKVDSTLLVDSDHVLRVPTTRAIKVPITAIAERETGRRITANIVALGLIVGLTNVVSRDALRQSVVSRAPHGTEEINLKALEAGLAEAETICIETRRGWR